MEKLILVIPAKNRRYVQDNPNPTVRVDRGTYKKLQEVAARTGMSLSAACKKLVDFAVENVQYVREE
jgi:hypothetical protein